MRPAKSHSCESKTLSISQLHDRHNQKRKTLGVNMIGWSAWLAVKAVLRPGTKNIAELSDLILAKLLGQEKSRDFLSQVDLPEEIIDNLESEDRIGVLVFGNHERKIEPPFIIAALMASASKLKKSQEEFLSFIKFIGINLFAPGIKGLDDLLIAVVPKPLATDYRGNTKRGFSWRLFNTPISRNRMNLEQTECFNMEAKELAKRYILDERKIFVVFPTASRDIKNRDNWRMAGAIAYVLHAALEQKGSSDFYLLPFDIGLEGKILPGKISAELFWLKPIKASQFFKEYNLTSKSNIEDIKKALYKYYMKQLEELSS